VSHPDGFEDLFILSPPHSGTTAMAKLLLGSPRIWSRIANAEGFKLPESAGFLPLHPWDTAQVLDCSSLRAVWEEGRPPGSILLEKSPPNLAHLERLLEVWPKAFFVISVRNPLAVMAVYLRRRAAEESEVKRSVSRWVARSRLQRRNAERLGGRAIITTYEAFTREPGALVEQLERVFGPLSIDPERPLSLKRYAPARISDHNAREIANVSGPHLELARRLLDRHGEEMAFWGY
jgi:hypothetical protein